MGVAAEQSLKHQPMLTPNIFFIFVLLVPVLTKPDPSPDDLHIHIHGLDNSAGGRSGNQRRSNYNYPYIKARRVNAKVGKDYGDFSDDDYELPSDNVGSRRRRGKKSKSRRRSGKTSKSRRRSGKKSKSRRRSGKKSKSMQKHYLGTGTTLGKVTTTTTTKTTTTPYTCVECHGGIRLWGCC